MLFIFVGFALCLNVHSYVLVIRAILIYCNSYQNNVAKAVMERNYNINKLKMQGPYLDNSPFYIIFFLVEPSPVINTEKYLKCISDFLEVVSPKPQTKTFLLLLLILCFILAQCMFSYLCYRLSCQNLKTANRFTLHRQ